MGHTDGVYVRQHRAIRSEPDLLLLQVIGDVTESDVTALLSHEERVRAEFGYSLVLVDAAQMDVLPPKVRKHVATLFVTDPTYRGAVAIAGASFAVRTVMGFLIRATDLLSGKPTEPMRFFRTQSESLAWLHAQRSNQVRQRNLRLQTGRPIPDPPKF